MARTRAEGDSPSLDRIIQDQLDATRSNSLQPFHVLPDRGQHLTARVRDNNNILNPHSTNILVLRQNVVVDVLRVPHRRKEMRRKVAARFDCLRTSVDQFA